MESTCRALHAGFFNSEKSHPENIALDFGDRTLTYGKLRTLSLRITSTIEGLFCEDPSSHWVALLCGKTACAYASILGILASGKGYVPLSCDSPPSRLADMLIRSGARLILVDEYGTPLLTELLNIMPYAVTVCVVVDAGAANVHHIPREHGPVRHTFLNLSPLRKIAADVNLVVREDLPAYLLFTSGSTGRPKGVVVSHGNVRHFLDYVRKQYDFNSTDRFSQNFDFTFDLSVFDIFACFENGACLCPPGAGDKIFLKRYINRSKLTVWFSVPSAVSSMQATRQIEEDSFQGLRYSLFCGEPLTVKAARLWQDAARNSCLINMYGPTEVTICCTAYAWDNFHADYLDEHIVPIGNPFPGLSVKLLDENQVRVKDGQVGELWIGGAQVAIGYLDDHAETQKRFVYDENSRKRFYRTGDRAYYDKHQLHFTGRVDHQVKVRGYRIELGEVEIALRACTDRSSAIAIPWPPTGLYDKLIAVIEADPSSMPTVEQLLSNIRCILPSYMVPSEVIYIEKLPLNSNGKIDRRATVEILTQKYIDK